MELLLDEARGIYIPHDFAECFSGWDGIDPEDLESVTAGPGDEWYWEAWDNILSNAFYIDDNGDKWSLWQDGDLLACKQGENPDDDECGYE